MKVLIAGGGGYIGSHIAWYLVKAGHKPVVMDNWSSGRPERVDGIDLSTAEAQERPKARAAFEHFAFDAAVFAVAPPLEARPQRLRASKMIPACVGGAVVLGELCARFGVANVVVLSSGAVYGATGLDGVPEDAPERPECLRGDVDLCMERIFGGYAAEGAFGLHVLRLFNVAGASPDGGNGEAHDPERHLVPVAIRALLKGVRLPVWGAHLATPDGSAVRDFVHVLDVAEAVRLCLEGPPRRGHACYNVAAGRGTSVREVIAAAERVAGKSAAVVPGTPDVPVVGVRVGRIEKIQKALGWEPRHSAIEEILATQWDFARHVARDAPEDGPLSTEETSANLFGEVAFKLGFVRREDVALALRKQQEDVAAGRPHRLLGIVMLQENMITSAQLIEILRCYEQKPGGAQKA